MFLCCTTHDNISEPVAKYCAFRHHAIFLFVTYRYMPAGLYVKFVNTLIHLG